MPAFVHGHAVVFPDCDFPAGVEAVSAPRKLVLDAGDLAGDVGARVEALFRAWGEGRAAVPLTKKWIAPWAARPRAALLAHADARVGARVGGEGKEPLAHHLRSACGSWEGLAGRVWAGSYHELAKELCERAGVAWSEPPDDLSDATRDFWNETSGLLLLEAAAKLGEKWDALVVDEAQEGREDELPEHDGDRRVPRHAGGEARGRAAAHVAVGGAWGGAEGGPLE